VPIAYKFNVLEALKEKGYTTYKLRKEKLLAESTVQALRRGDLVALDNIARICAMLQCQPGDILIYNDDPTEGGADCG
jgi:putative transcriptional regulator